MKTDQASRKWTRDCLLACAVLGVAASSARADNTAESVAFDASSLGPAVQGKWYVDGNDGSNRNDCMSPQNACKTIGRAIKLSASGDSIFVAAAIYPENLRLPHSLNIIGANPATTIIDGGGGRSVLITAPFGVALSATVSNVTMRNGGGNYGGGIGDGGNIYNCAYPKRASLTISDSIIAGGRAGRGHHHDGYGGGIYNCGRSKLVIIQTTIRDNSSEVGGAICNGGILTIRKSTFVGNRVRELKAGAIGNYGRAVIDNSTFSINSSGPMGQGGAIKNGGILYHAPGTLFISNSTFSGNEAGDGGGIFTNRNSTTVLQNSIVANNKGGNCSGVPTSKGYNLSSDASCALSGTGDLNNTDPKLGRLKDNGGPTPTMALLPGSPAIDSGNPNGCTDNHGHLLPTDQRGKPRPDNEDSNSCDRGAFERQKG